MVLTALVQHGPALSQTSCVGRFGQAPIKRTVNSLCHMFWCTRYKGDMGRAISDVPCTLSPNNNTSGTASYFCRWPNPDVSEESEGNLVAWRLLREQQKRGCSTKDDNPAAAAVLVRVVSSPAGVSAPVTKEGKWAGSSDSHHVLQTVWCRSAKWGVRSEVNAGCPVIKWLQRRVQACLWCSSGGNWGPSLLAPWVEAPGKDGQSS